MKYSNDGSCLTPSQLYALGIRLAQRYAPGSVTRALISGLYEKPIPMPVIIRCGETSLWIDRHYAAVETKGRPVTYVYMTKMHIWEERRSYREAAKERADDSIRLPEDIARQFKTAARAMRAGGTKIWVHGNFKAFMETA